MPSFWGLVVKGSNPTPADIPDGVAVTLSSVSLLSTKDQTAQLWVTIEDKQFLVCTLQKGKVDQYSVDLNVFSEQDPKFFVKGEGEFHLIGFIQPIYDDEGSDEDSESDGEIEEMQFDDSESEEESPKAPLKLANGPTKAAPAKAAAPAPAKAAVPAPKAAPQKNAQPAQAKAWGKAGSPRPSQAGATCRQACEERRERRGGERRRGRPRHV